MGTKRRKKFLFFFLILVLVGLGGSYFYFAEREKPQVNISPEKGFITEDTELTINVQDSKSGLSSINIQAVQGNKKTNLVDKEFKTPLSQWDRVIKIKGNNFQDDLVKVQVSARDRSWTNFFKGNLSVQEANYQLDTKPPDIVMESYRHNLNQGGTGIVAFTISEPVQKAGVQVDKYFFPAYQQENGIYLCMFSFPYNLQPAKAQPMIKAMDRSGNIKQSGFMYHINSQNFVKERLKVGSDFLNRKMVQFKDDFPTAENNLEIFLQVNGELRMQNREELIKIGRKSVSRTLWTGKFLRQPGAERKASFGDIREYIYQGEKVDQQTHLGIDLASVARSPVPASNSGRVVFADWMGIYGKTVIIDHGLGLQTLYGHLSHIKVKIGDQVEQGDIIGKTGATGLAAGDHLHFAVLVSGVPVNPVEWWDASWIKNNVQEKLNLRDRKD